MNQSVGERDELLVVRGLDLQHDQHDQAEQHEGADHGQLQPEEDQEGGRPGRVHLLGPAILFLNFKKS